MGLLVLPTPVPLILCYALFCEIVTILKIIAVLYCVRPKAMMAAENAVLVDALFYHRGRGGEQ